MTDRPMKFEPGGSRPHEQRIRECPYCDGTGMLPPTRREVTAEMAALRQSGLTIQEIASRYGLTRQAVSERLRRQRSVKG